MKIAVKNSIVATTHADSQDVSGLYPGCLVLAVPDGTPVEIGQVWEVTVEQAVAARTIEAAAAMQTALDPLAARFPEHETKTWPEQLAEAKAILDGEGDPEPTIEKYPAIGNIIAETGESWGDFAMAVKANNAAWTAITCNVAGQRQKFVKAIKSAASAPGATVADVLAVPLAITLPA